MTWLVLSTGIANDIRALRELRGLTQAQLAAQTGSKQSVISRLESKAKNQYMPQVRTLQLIAEAMDANLIIQLIPKEAHK